MANLQAQCFLVVAIPLAVAWGASCGAGRVVGLEATDAGAPPTDGGPDAGVDAGAFDPTAHVNPFIGTDGNGLWGIGNTLPGPMAPFGMVKPGPDTLSLNPPVPANYNHCGGYYYRDEYITGFSQTHFSGTGIPEYGNLGIMPRLGRDTAKLAGTEYMSLFNKETEAAEPGHYTVTLADGIEVGITASDRAAFYRFTYPDAAGDRCVIIDLGHLIPLTTVTSTGLTVEDDGTFVGHLHAYGGLTAQFNGYTIYFKGAVTPAPSSVGAWNADRVFLDGARSCGGGKACGALVCRPDATVIEVRVAISFVSAAKARENFAVEAEGRAFDDVRAETREKWRAALARFRIAGGSGDALAVFYTALYHVFSMPTLMSDVDGSYLGFDEQPHTVDWGAGARYYSDFSLWDTYRALHPLLTLAYRDRQREMVNSLVAQGRTGGYLPKLSVANGETNAMVGTSADVVIADSYLKGIDFPAVEAFEIAMRTALHPTSPGSGYVGREGIGDYLTLGYLAADRFTGSVSKTQEYALSDNALCAMAQKLGRAEAGSLCRTRYNHRNLWDPANAVFLARNADGEFPGRETFNAGAVVGDVYDPSNRAYVEGNALQYRWFAPHDAAWLIDALGGVDSFVRELQAFYENSKAEEALLVRGTKEWGSPRTYYWQGNEPDFHIAYLFSAAGRADLACDALRWTTGTNFLNAPDGLPGNDDAGTTSAWYVFSALGFYPIPGTDLYYVGCPLFARAEVALENGTLTVVADGPLADGATPKKIFWNGGELPRPELTWGQIKDGGELRFSMEL